MFVATVNLLEKAAKQGQRSSFIARAIKFYIESQSKTKLRQELKQGYLANSKQSLEIAQEWFNIDEEAWHGKISK